MHQGSDYTSSYYPHHPNPNPNPYSTGSAPASAPPFSAPAEFPNYPYTPYPQPPADPQPQFQPYNPSPYPHEPPVPAAASYPHLQQPYYQYDSHQPPAAVTNYNPAPTPTPTHNPGSFSSAYPSFDAPDSGNYYNNSGGYGVTTPAAYADAGFSFGGSQDGGFGEGVYRYDGGGAEPYGARGSGSVGKPALSGFDDYGRPKSFSGKEQGGGTTGVKIVRAVPKMDTQEDVKSGVPKFRVKLLAEGGGQSTQDVLCQIGLDGIRMLDPGTNRTLRIYPLETVTRWEVTDTSIYSFWSKSFVDVEPRRIRLQSNSYTTSTILDTVTAAAVQLKEMGGRESLVKSGVADAGKQSDQPADKKKGLVDWMNIIKPGNEEKEHWIPDEAVTKCTSCGTAFNAFVRKHHCRNCGDIFCDKCTQGRTALTADESAQPVRVCDRCMAEVSQRLSNVKETASATKSAGLHSHEDLAKKLREEMERNKSSSGSKSSGGSAKRMREVACPTCTVHLQVQVPASGSETIECGVCQHPFLVSAH